MTIPLLQVRDLRVTFRGGVVALRGINFALAAGETLAVIGESGAGKSTLAHCLIGLIQAPEATGSVRIAGHELIGAPEPELRSLRWSTVALVPQAAAFNPVVRIGDQIAEPLTEHARMPKTAARLQARALAREALLDPDLLNRYAHELSGGERRRALLAMALALDPSLIVIDEPTAGVDPAGRVALLDQVERLTRSRGFALVVISHDLPAATRLASRSMLLYAGEAMEFGDTAAVIGRPVHPYGRNLLNAHPTMNTTKDLRPIRGHPPDPRALPGGCSFHPRCTQAEAICADDRPALAPSRGRLVACHFGGVKVLLSAVGVGKTFRTGRGVVTALDGVSFTVEHGEAVGVVGESGSGKTTLARILTGHTAPDAGHVLVGDEKLELSWSTRSRLIRRDVQLLMQDPWDALSPRLTVEELVREPLALGRNVDATARGQSVAEMLEAVGLPSTGGFLTAHVHELSGGQLQRIAFARALLCRPKLLVADEPTSLLDASEQARLMVVLRELQVEMGLALVLISHDIAVVRKVTDRIVVLHHGRVVEDRSSEAVSGSPRSSAARALVEAATTLELGASVRQAARTETAPP